MAKDKRKAYLIAAVCAFITLLSPASCPEPKPLIPDDLSIYDEPEVIIEMQESEKVFSQAFE